MTTPPESKPIPPTAPRSKWRKRWWKIALGILLALFLLILLLPTLLSSMGKNFLLGQVNSRIAGTVNADAISLGWFSGASLHNLTLKDPDGKVILTVPIADTGLSLSNALLSSTRHLNITIRAENATLIAAPDGTNNLSRAFAPKSAPTTPTAQPTSAPAPQTTATPNPESPAKPISVGNLIATFDIQITHITCQSPDAPTLSIDNTSLKGNLNTVTGDTKLTLSATAQSADGKPTALSADIAGNFFTDGTLKPLGEFTGNGQAAVHSLDLAAISPLLATAGVPLQLTGTLDASAKLDQKTAGKPSVDADLTLSQLTATGAALDGDTLQRDQLKATLQATLNGDSVDVQQLALTTESLSAKINGTLQTSPTAAPPKQPLTIAATVDVTDLKKQLPHLLGSIPDTTATLNFTGHADASKKLLTITADSSLTEKDPTTGLGTTIAFTGGSILSWGNGNNNLTLPITYDLARAQQILAKSLPTGTILSGTRTITLHITGPLADAPGLAALQHLSIDPATFGYDRIFVKGFELSKADVGISMKSGILTLAPSSLPANQGTIHLAGRVDCTQTPAAFILDKSPQGTQLVDNVSLNQQIAAGPLAFLPISWGGDKNNPTLGTVTGKLNVNLDQALIPLDSAAFKTKGSTSGKISISNLTTNAPFFAQISGTLGSVLQLAHANTSVQGASISNGVFALKDGKVTYENLTIGASQFNMNFSGSVGLDTSIAMNMNLTVASLNLPIPIGVAGTTDHPKITVSDRGIGKNIGNVIQKAIPKDLGRNIGDLFRRH
jgi:Domain of Unknown Function (DUF748)